MARALCSCSKYLALRTYFSDCHRLIERLGEGFRRAMILRLFLNGSDGLALAATLKIPQGSVQPRKFDAVCAEQPT